MLHWSDTCAAAAQKAAEHCCNLGRAVQCFLECPAHELGRELGHELGHELLFGQNVFHLSEQQEDITVSLLAPHYGCSSLLGAPHY